MNFKYITQCDTQIVRHNGGADIKFVTIIRNLFTIIGQGIRGWGGEGRALGNGVEVMDLKTATVKRIRIQVIGMLTDGWMCCLTLLFFPGLGFKFTEP